MRLQYEYQLIIKDTIYVLGWFLLLFPNFLHSQDSNLIVLIFQVLLGPGSAMQGQGGGPGGLPAMPPMAR